MNPGPGWKNLKQGEIIVEGDEFWGFKGWRRSTRIGLLAKIPKYYRRKTHERIVIELTPEGKST